jgi:hypothetical protein
LYDSGKTIKGPVGDGIDIPTGLQEKALGNLFALDAVFHTKIASLFMIHRIEFTPTVCAGAKW